jgi:hypothetical protein
VVAATAAQFRALLAPDAPAPRLGMPLLAHEQGTTVLGIVVGMENRSLDPSRTPIPRGLGREELLRENPHLAGLLVTELGVAACGEQRDDAWRQGVPAQPLPIHALIYPCAVNDMLAFLGGAIPRFHYLRLLLGSGDVEGDGAVQAHLGWLAGLPGGAGIVRPALAELGRLLVKDYARLRHIVAGVEA